MPGSVEVQFWTEDKGKVINPSAHAIVFGGNVGHAAVKVTLLASEKPLLDKYNETLTKLGIRVTTLQTRRLDDGKLVKEPYYEIYFSFWPGSIIVAENEDRLGEWEGRKAEKTPLVNPNDQQSYSDRRKSIFSLFVNRLLHRNPDHDREKVFSGVRTIVHLNQNEIAQMAETILKRIEPQRKDEEFQKLHAIFLSGVWDDRIIPYIEYINKKISDLENKQQRTALEENDLTSLNNVLIKILKNWRPGVSSDYAITFDADACSLNLERILQAMIHIAENKKYQLLGWNCSSTALSIMFSGVPAALADDEKHQSLYKHKRLLNVMNEKIPTYTPTGAMKLAMELDSALRESTLYGLKTITTEEQNKEAETEVTRLTSMISEMRNLYIQLGRKDNLTKIDQLVTLINLINKENNLSPYEKLIAIQNKLEDSFMKAAKSYGRFRLFSNINDFYNRLNNANDKSFHYPRMLGLIIKGHYMRFYRENEKAPELYKSIATLKMPKMYMRSELFTKNDKPDNSHKQRASSKL